MDSTYRANLTRVVSGEGAYCMVPRLGQGVEFGPCQTLVSLAGKVPGAALLVTTVAGIPEDLVILGVLT